MVNHNYEQGGISMINYFDKAPLTISMWDFSWLKGNHLCGAYEDLSLRIEEAKEHQDFLDLMIW